MFWAVFLCLQWVLFLLMFDAWCSLCIKDERILCLLHKILWLMFSSPWLFFVKTRSLFQIFSSNVAHFPCYQNSLMETLLMRGFSLGVVDSIKSWRSTNIVLRKNINVILTFTDNSVKECWWFCCIICGCILELSVSHGCYWTKHINKWSRAEHPRRNCRYNWSSNSWPEIITVKENLYNVFKCFSNKALKYRAYTHLCNTSSLVTVVETAI